ncbi:hypothetical protein [Candidatus Regiella endosymbiont of Tuberolachnus salignus]|uniref:hypothetical protein n=1 Tax=Candidatus Regiella endosymbiont of Tuberolachnus salignus TaxID=3077956 RepID=UPI0030CDA85E
MDQTDVSLLQKNGNDRPTIHSSTPSENVEKHTKYNTEGKLLHSFIFSYDDEKQLKFVHETVNQYDTHGRLINNTERWYDKNSRLHQNKKKRYVYDAQGNLLISSDIDYGIGAFDDLPSKITNSEYDTNGRLVAQHIVANEYDSNHKLLTRHTTKRQYDANGQLLHSKQFQQRRQNQLDITGSSHEALVAATHSFEVFNEPLPANTKTSPSTQPSFVTLVANYFSFI